LRQSGIDHGNTRPWREIREHLSKPAPVSYELLVYQQEIPAGTLDGPQATVPGLKEIGGRIEPVCFFGENELKLQTQDRRKLLFVLRTCKVRLR
jgi:hypothetical protein